MPPSSGGVLAYKSVAFTFEDTEATIELPEGAMVVDTITSMSTVFDGTAPTVDIDLSGSDLGTDDPGNAVTHNTSGLLPARGTLVTLTIDADDSAEGEGQFIVIYAVI